MKSLRRIMSSRNVLLTTTVLLLLLLFMWASPPPAYGGILRESTVTTSGGTGAFTVTQSGTGSIADFKDGATSVFQISDGGIVSLFSGATFDDTGGTFLEIKPNTGDYVRIGDAAATSHSLSSEDDFLITGNLEVDGTAWFDGDMVLGDIVTDTITVNGTTTSTGTGTFSNNLVVDGSTYLGGITDGLVIDADGHITDADDSVTISEALSVSGAITASSTLAVTSTLTASGAIDANSYIDNDYTGASVDALNINFAPSSATSNNALDILASGNVQGPAVLINQQGTGDILQIQDAGTVAFSIDDDGSVAIVDDSYSIDTATGLGDLYVAGDLEVDGTVSLGSSGDIQIGTSSSQSNLYFANDTAVIKGNGSSTLTLGVSGDTVNLGAAGVDYNFSTLQTSSGYIQFIPTTFTVIGDATVTGSHSLDANDDLLVSGEVEVDGAAFFDGAVTLGNATGDDITLTGYLASSIVPKTDDTYDLGTSSLRFGNVYATNLTSSGSGSFTDKTTVTADTADYALRVSQSGTGDIVQFRDGTNTVFDIADGGAVTMTSSASIDSATIGGGYGATGVTISNAGAIQANDALTVDGGSTLTGATTIGGADDGLSITTAGALSDVDGTLTISDDISISGSSTLSGTATLSKALYVTGYSVIGSWSTTHSLGSAGDLKVTGNLEVDGVTYLDGDIDLGDIVTDTITVNGTVSASGTANFSDQLTVQGSAFLATTAGRVGIGTTAPDSQLHILGTNDSTGGIMIESSAGTGADRLAIYPMLNRSVAFKKQLSDTSLIFLDSSDNREMILTGDGHLGINVDSPDFRLHVVDTTFPVALIDRATTETNTIRASLGVGHSTSNNMADGFGAGFTFQIDDNSSSWENIAGVYGVRDGADNTGALMLYTYTGGNGSEKMRITNDGLVGIATTVPAAKLDVSASTITPAIQATQSGTGNLANLKDGITAVFTVADGGALTIKTTTDSTTGIQVLDADGGTPILNIDTTNERVGIGTTTPTTKLHLYSSGVSGANLLIEEPGPRITWIESGATADNTRWDFLADDASFRMRAVNDANNAANNWVKIERTGTTIDSVVFENGLVGIGTTAPASTLTVSGSGLIQSSTNITKALQVLSSQGTSVFQVDTTNGRVGIGTTTPDYKLTISHNSNAVLKLLTSVTSTASAGAAIVQYQDDGAAIAAGHRMGGMYYGAAENASNSLAIGAAILSNADETWDAAGHGSRITFETVPNNSTTRAERMRIDNVGNVGIGTITPSQLLHVAGSGTFDTNVAIGTTAPATTEAGTLQTIGTALFATISGNVGIGTTAPGQKLDVNGNAVISGGYIQVNDTTWGYYVPDNVPISVGNSADFSVGSVDGTKLSLSVGTSLGSATGVTMDTSGKVGIGNTVPATGLHIGTAASTHSLNTANDVIITGKLEVDGETFLDGDINLGDIVTDTITVNGTISASGTASFSDQLTVQGTALLATTAGRVGIGTTAPGYRLEVPWLSGDAATTAYFGSSNASNDQIAIEAVSYSDYGIKGTSTSSVGVWGTSTSNYGVYGTSTDSYGVRGVSTSNIGVYGQSTSGWGVYGASTSSFGVYGGSSTSRAGYFLRNNVAGTATTAVFEIIQDSATSETNTVLRIQGDGTGDLVNIFDTATEVVTVLDGGNVGIGNTAPVSTLTVSGSGLIQSSTNITKALQVLSSQGTSVFQVDTTNGRVGIGTTTPGAALDIIDNDSANSIRTRHSNLSQGINIGYTYINKLASTASSNLVLNAKGAGYIILQDTTTGTGYVGIGTTTPSQMLHVAGSGEFDNNIIVTGQATVGGGYGSTGATISTAGVIQANGAITTDGALTADSTAIGGGYGSTGVTISNAGAIQANASLTVDGASTLTGSATLSKALYVTGYSVIGSWSTTHSLGSAGDLKVTGNLEVDGETFLDGDINLGDVTTDILTVNATSTYDGTGSFTNNLVVSGISYLGGTDDGLAVSADGYITDVDDNITLNEATDVNGNLAVGGGYGDTGATISSAGVLQANGALTVDGASTLTGAATIGGADDGLSVTNDGALSDVDDALTIADEVSISATTTTPALLVVQSGTGDILNIKDGATSVFRIEDGGAVSFGAAGSLVLGSAGESTDLIFYEDSNISAVGTGTISIGQSGNTIYLASDGATYNFSTLETTAGTNLTLKPGGSNYTIVGDAGSTSHSLAANDDLYITGKLEVDGETFLDGDINLGDIVTDTITVNGTTTSSGTGSFTNNLVVSGISYLGGTDDGLSISADGYITDVDDNITLNEATDVNGNLAVGGGYGDTGATISSAGVLQANGAITTDSTLTVTSTSTLTGTATIGGADDGIQIGADGAISDIDGTALTISDDLSVSGQGTITGTASIAGGYGSTGVTVSTAGMVQANGAITTDGTLTSDNEAIGGGYGSTGVTVSNAGVIQANGAITTDGDLTSDSATIGGGYGSTGVTISNAGAIQANAGLTVDGASTLTGSATLSKALYVTGYSVIGAWSTTHSLGSAGDLKVTGKLEVDGETFLDGDINLGNIVTDTITVNGTISASGTASFSDQLTVQGTALLATTKGRVGIGTTVPGANLDIKAASSGDSTLRLTRGSSQDYGVQLTADQATGHVYIDSIGDSANPDIFFRRRTLGTPLTTMTLTGEGSAGIGTTTPVGMLQVVGTALFATTSGRVGIGTTAPGIALDVAGSIGASTGNTISIHESGGSQYFGIKSPATNAYSLSYGSSRTLAGANVLTWNTLGNVGIGTTAPATGTSGLQVIGTALFATTSGNVGIGITNPTNKLDITVSSASTTYSAGNTGIFQFVNSDATAGNMTGIVFSQAEATTAGAGLAGIHRDRTGGARDSDLGFYTSNNSAVTQKMIITGTGNVGIGNTVPATGLHIGTAASTHSLNTANDVIITGKLEVDGETFLDGDINLGDIVTDTITINGTISASGTASFSDQLTVQGTALLATTKGRVGIGTTLPLNTLDVRGDIFTDRWITSDTNTFLGIDVVGAGNLAHTAGTEGYYNTAIGNEALYSNTTGARNIALGYQSLYTNTIGYNNNAFGYLCLKSNTEGTNNNAFGYASLYFNTIGTHNTAFGYASLYYNTEGTNNNAFGFNSLRNNTTGTYNNGIGRDTIYYNQTGSHNQAMGYRAGGAGTVGVNSFSNSVMIGSYAGYSITSGSNNIMLGYAAGQSLTTGTKNIVIGYDIDTPAVDSANTLNIGNLIYATGLDGADTTLSTGSVGIGTTAPAAKLDVSASTITPATQVSQAGTGDIFVLRDTTTNKFRMIDGGQIGIQDYTPVSTTLLGIDDTVSLASGTNYGLYSKLTNNDQTSGSATIEGLYIASENSSFGAVTNQYGANLIAENNSGGQIATSYAAYAESINDAADATAKAVTSISGTSLISSALDALGNDAINGCKLIVSVAGTGDYDITDFDTATNTLKCTQNLETAGVTTSSTFTIAGKITTSYGGYFKSRNDANAVMSTSYGLYAENLNDTGGYMTTAYGAYVKSTSTTDSEITGTNTGAYIWTAGGATDYGLLFRGDATDVDITTYTNEDLIIMPNGTGSTIIGDATATGSHSIADNDSLIVGGNLEVDGTTWLDGHIILGDATADNITVTGTLTSSAATTMNDAVTITASSNSPALTLTQNGTGNLITIKDASTEMLTIADGGAVTVTGATTMNGDVTLGNASGDSLIVTASLASSIIPDTDDTYDLGSVSLRFANVYGVNLSSGGSGTFANKTTISDDTTDYALRVTQSGTGNIAEFRDGATDIVVIKDGGITFFDSALELDETSKPANVANHGFVYTKDVSGATELFFEDDSANEVQITSSGSMNTTPTTLDEAYDGASGSGSGRTITVDSNAVTLNASGNNKGLIVNQTGTANIVEFQDNGSPVLTVADGGTTSIDTLEIGGGYGSTGITVSNAGLVQVDGAITADSTVTIAGTATLATTAGRVGVGTTAPEELLHVLKANGAGDVAMLVHNNDTTNGETASVLFRTTTATTNGAQIKAERIGANDTSLKFATLQSGSLTDTLTIDNEGQVGIGNTVPATGLHVGTAASTHSLTSANDVIITGKLEVDGETFLDGDINLGDIVTDTITINGTISASGTASFSDQLTVQGTALLATTAGRVGIGTTAPSYRLHVPWLSGDATYTAYFGSSNASNNQTAILGRSSSSYGVYGVSTSSYGVYGLSTSSIGVRGDSGTNRAGYFYRNNTAGTATTAVVDIIQDSATSETNTVLRIQGDGTGDLVNIFDGATEVVTILDGGSVGIGTTAPATAVKLHVAGTGIFDGKVGIGTTVPAAPLHIVSTNTVNGLFIDQNASTATTAGNAALGIDNTGNTRTGLYVYSNLGNTAAARLAIIRADNTAFDQNVLDIFNDGTQDSLKIVVGAGNGRGLFINNTGSGDSLIVDAGNVGIGTTVPSQMLHVAGSGEFDNNVIVSGEATVGGGYGATGATISTAGVIQANGAITTDGDLTSDSATIGGGYGSTGVTISNAGAIQANAGLTIDGASTLTGSATLSKALYVTGYSVIGAWSTTHSLGSAGDLKVTGKLEVDGETFLDGDINLGDIVTDTITINGTISASGTASFSDQLTVQGTALLATTAGRVGIGVTAPNAKLQLYDDTQAAGDVTIANIRRQYVAGGGLSAGLQIISDGLSTGTTKLQTAGSNTQNMGLGPTGEDLFIQRTTLNVGIGTTAPATAAKLHVAGTGIFDGKVGIGTTAPTHELHVADGKIITTSSTAYSVEIDPSNGPRLNIGTPADTDNYMAIGAYNSINNIDTKGRNLRIFSNADTTGINYLTSNGNLGIGTTAPGAALDVIGSGRFITDAAAVVGLTVQGTASQSGNLTSWVTSTGTAALSIMADGDIKTDRWLDSDTNTFIGVDVAGDGSLAHTTGTQGWENTAVGNVALYSNTTGYSNTAIGYRALYVNTGGVNNTAVGHRALDANTGNYSTAVGASALRTNTGAGNSAMGYGALLANTQGASNTAMGGSALQSTVTGSNNTAVGYQVGLGVASNSFSNNSLFGFKSGYALTTGSNNVLLGYQAGNVITTGTANIIIGYDVDPPTATTHSFLNIGDTIYGDLSTDKVGIGNTAPATGLHIGTAASTHSLTSANDVIITGKLEVDGETFLDGNINLGDIVTDTITVNGTTVSTGTGTFTNNMIVSGVSYLGGTDDGLAISADGYITDVDDNITLNEATDVNGNLAVGGGYGDTGATISSAGGLQANGAITTDGALTADSTAIGGGYGSTGVTISNAGAIQANAGLTIDGASTLTGAATIGGSADGLSVTTDGALSDVDDALTITDEVAISATTITPALLITQSGTGNLANLKDGTTAVFTVADGGALTIKTATDSTTGIQILDADGGTPILNIDTTNERVGVGTTAPAQMLHVAGSGEFDNNIIVSGEATVGGGYGATGATISTAGVIQANGAITTDGALTADSTAIGGGYGATGVTISNAGAIQANAGLTVDGASTLSGTATLSKALYVTGYSVIGSWSTTHSLGSAGDLKVTGNLEVDGETFLDGDINLGDIVTDTITINGTISASGTASFSDQLTVQGTALLATTAGRVGIGTTTPANRLHVPWLSGDAITTAYFGSTNASNNQAAIEGRSYSNFGVLGVSTSSRGVYGVSTSNAGVWGASTSGIGVCGVSSSNFGVQGASTSSVGVRGSSTSYYGVYGVSTTNSAGYFYRNNVAGAATTAVLDVVQDSATAETNTVLRIQGDGTGDLVNIFDGATEVVTVLDGGNLGIGTTAPTTEKFVVAGGVDITGAADNISGDSGLGISFESTYARIQSFGSKPLALNPLGNKIGIGTTAPASALSVGGAVTTSTPELRVYGYTTDTQAGEYGYFKVEDTTDIFEIGTESTVDGIRLLPGAAKPVIIGDATTAGSHSIADNDSLIVSGNLEVDGTAWFDGNMALGDATVDSITVNGTVTASGVSNLNERVEITASTANAALKVTQNGTGDVLQLYDAGTEVLRVVDGGGVYYKGFIVNTHIQEAFTCDLDEVDDFEIGKVVEFGNNAETQIAKTAGSNCLVGVLAARPGESRGFEDNELMVAYLGKYFVLVEADSAPIKKGDILVASPVTGYACSINALEATDQPIGSIGVALEDMDTGRGKIAVMLSVNNSAQRLLRPRFARPRNDTTESSLRGTTISSSLRGVPEGDDEAISTQQSLLERLEEQGKQIEELKKKLESMNNLEERLLNLTKSLRGAEGDEAI